MFTLHDNDDDNNNDNDDNNNNNVDNVNVRLSACDFMGSLNILISFSATYIVYVCWDLNG